MSQTGTLLNAEDTAVNKTDKSFALLELTFWRMRQIINKRDKETYCMLDGENMEGKDTGVVSEP